MFVLLIMRVTNNIQ